MNRQAQMRISSYTVAYMEVCLRDQGPFANRITPATLSRWLDMANQGHHSELAELISNAWLKLLDEDDKR
jgi:hypothetical protein